MSRDVERVEANVQVVVSFHGVDRWMSGDWWSNCHRYITMDGFPVRRTDSNRAGARKADVHVMHNKVMHDMHDIHNMHDMHDMQLYNNHAERRRNTVWVSADRFNLRNKDST